MTSSMMSQAADAPADRQRPRIKVWLEIDGRYSFGHGIAEILSAIERTGSIKVAASELGKSYRYVWGRVKQAEQTLGQTLVQTQVGGQGERRSLLTEFARHSLDEFRALRQRMIELVEQEFAQHAGKLHRRAD
ncbi:MAG: LysR family transcriptional regulator [Planctomycetales bacterium]|nr:LysR family transcriptional regulator [Planctomycetales bacterium]